MEKKNSLQNTQNKVAPAQLETTVVKNRGHLFKKGYDPRREGNGRKKGSRTLTNILRESLMELDKDRKNGTYSQQLVKKIIEMAIEEGDKDMIRLCFEYLEGKPKSLAEDTQVVEVSESSFFDESGRLRVRERTAKQIDESTEQ